MTIYHAVVFVHVVSAMGLFAALAVEWVGLRFLSKADTVEQARDSVGLWRVLPKLGIPVLLALLASGIYLAASIGGFELWWIRLTFPALVVIAALGAAGRPGIKAVEQAVATGTGQLSPAQTELARAPRAHASWRLRCLLAAAVVFLMTERPELPGSVVVLAGALLLGVAWSLGAWRSLGRATA
jgi:type IV secretory pathway protease TraF